MDRKLQVDAMREALDWYEAHPEVEMPYSWKGQIMCPLNTKEELQAFARAAGKATRKDDGMYAGLIKEFPRGMSIFAYVPRGQVCRPKLKEVVVVPAQAERTYERVVEWECIPILSDEEVSA